MIPIEFKDIQTYLGWLFVYVLSKNIKPDPHFISFIKIYFNCNIFLNEKCPKYKVRKNFSAKKQYVNNKNIN